MKKQFGKKTDRACAFQSVNQRNCVTLNLHVLSKINDKSSLNYIA